MHPSCQRGGRESMERFFDYAWRGLFGMALFAFVLPVLAFLVGELSGDDLAVYCNAFLNGVTRGCLYGLVAIALTLIVRTQGLVNFAQGEFVALSMVAVITLPIVLGTGYWSSAALVVAFVTLIAMLSGSVMHVLMRKPFVTVLMATLGLGLLTRVLTGELAQIWPGATMVAAPFLGKHLTIAGIILPSQSLAVILVTISLCGGLFLFVRHSQWGASVRAVWLHRMDDISEQSMRKIAIIAWGLAGGFGAVAGIFMVPVGVPGEGVSIILFKAIAAMVLGGFGSLRGALIGGLMIGASEALAGYYAWQSAERVVGYVILLAVLIIRPHGLWGESRNVRRMNGAALS